ncbi:MAG: hypothetical protein M3P45_10285, partial [Acidobacteriota bacterium]|nr:hypothetical protein [Acidobacteriota bacterium]
EFTDRMLMPMQLVIFSGQGESYGAWVKLGMVRTGGKQPEVVRPQGITAAQHAKELAKWRYGGESQQKTVRGEDARSERNERDKVKTHTAGLVE